MKNLRDSKSNHHQSGYILILTLLMLSASVAVVTYIFTRGSTHVPFIQTMIDREKAKLIALGGLQVAIAQLAQKDEIKEEKEATKEQEQKTDEQQQKKQDPQQEAKKFLERILPVINRWQEFVLKEEVDGIDAELKLCLMCEEGKININQIYDFKKKAFRGQGQVERDWQKLLQVFFKRIQQEVGGQDLFVAFEKFLKERQYKLHDVTELLKIKEFVVFKRYQFYEPPERVKNPKKDKKRPVYLTDLFTVHSNKQKLQPWLFSDSLLGTLELKRAESGDVDKRKQVVQDWLKLFKRSGKWKEDWNKLLVPIYERELQSLPKGIELVLESTFEPKLFSVLVYGKVGTGEQRLFAILERIKNRQDDDIIYDIKIKKLYWL